ncbi:STAS domain-containing protein [Streptomyces subrutilus]|uniref:STAS domain-containing protein n=1 Tax=Streptomyces subrutilus TaxID=36818 RepID=UPI002E110811|nr:STAS domain-containing protein [Streptomyces subrutilus]
MVRGIGSERFTVAVRAVDGTVVLSLDGELDHDTAQPLREALDAAVTPGGRLLVDLGGLGFCDSTGLNVLLHTRLTAREAGASLELAGLRGPVARMFRITGADEVFPVHGSVAEALDGQGGADGPNGPDGLSG